MDNSTQLTGFFILQTAKTFASLLKRLLIIHTELMFYFQISSASSQVLKGIPLYHTSLSKFNVQKNVYMEQVSVTCKLKCTNDVIIFLKNRSL
jgi:hypothetical protein